MAEIYSTLQIKIQKFNKNKFKRLIFDYYHLLPFKNV